MSDIYLYCASFDKSTKGNNLRTTVHHLIANNVDHIDSQRYLTIETFRPDIQLNHQHVLPTQTKSTSSFGRPRQDGKSLTSRITIGTNLETTQAYDKYQERKAKKQIQQVGFETEPSSNPELLEQKANSEILEKAGISPPSYRDVVVNRADLPAYVDVSEKEIKQDLIEDLTYTESIHDVPDGLRGPNAHRGHAQPAYVEAPARSGCCGTQSFGFSSRGEQKRAEKLARKAEKQAAKSAKVQPIM
jgi:hypothetical protein